MITLRFVPIAPLYKIEHLFARLGRWRRLSRCYEGTAASARPWLEVASIGYLLARLRVEPTYRVRSRTGTLSPLCAG